LHANSIASVRGVKPVFRPRVPLDDVHVRVAP
jgi:hypothetical protein